MKERAERLVGLEREVEVRFDAGGVPHVYASSLRDLFFAQGWITARERFFQMDFTRWATQGRLAEHVGDRPLDADAFSVFLDGKKMSDLDWLMRCFGLLRAAKRSMDVISSDARSTLEAYADGVNRFLTSRLGPPTLEHGLLRVLRAEPWLPTDSMLILKGLAFDQSGAWRTILIWEALAIAFDKEPEKLRALIPAYPKGAGRTVKMSAADERSFLELVALEESWRAFVGYQGAHIGSNNWVLAPERTTTGRAILANDPHLGMTAPCPFGAVHLSAPGFEVAGVTLPGLPGIVLGHNERVAWGVTTACIQDADCFVEELDDKGRYRTPDGWAPLEITREEIRVQGQKESVVREIRRTRHGALISDVVGRDIGGGGRAIAYKWSGDEPSREIDTLLSASKAVDYKSWRESLRDLTAPCLNFVYADVDGNIGYQLAGKVPLRKDRGDGARPVPGWEATHDWERFLDLDEQPHAYNPEAGLIATANNRIVDESYPYPLSVAWEPYHRHQRIWQVLTGKPSVSTADCRALQTDFFSLWARNLCEGLIKPALREGSSLGDARIAKAKELLLAWDYVSHPDSAAASIYYRLYLSLAKKVLEPALGPHVFRAYFELINFSVLPLETTLLDETSPFLHGIDRRALVVRSLEEAVADLTRRLGPDPEQWKWGDLHQTTNGHPLGGVPGLGRIFNVGPYRMGGDGMTVNNGQFNYAAPFAHTIGAGMRAVYDAGDWDASTLVLSTGVSGRPRSRHYRDHGALWAEGRSFPFPFGRKAVEQETKERLRLTPG